MKMKLFFSAIAVAFVIASTQVALAAPALVISGDQCGLFDGFGNIVVSDESHITVTGSLENGLLHCRAQVSPPPATQFYSGETTGLICIVVTGRGVFVADNWSEVVSAGGNASLTCHINVKKK